MVYTALLKKLNHEFHKTWGWALERARSPCSTSETG